MRYSIFAAVAVGWLVSGCSIRPVPQDVTGAQYDTYGIVTRVRCEMRDAIKQYVLRSLRRHGADELAAELEKKRDAIRWLNARRRQLSPLMQAIIDKYDGALITYDFTFDITENNNIAANVNLGQTLTRGTFGLGISGGNDRERHNARTFRVADNFLKLSVDVSDDFCEGQDPRAPNYIYPITGSLNLFEMVGAFLDLNQSNNLTAKDGPPALSDNIQFVTKFTGSINPSIEISPIGRTLELAKAGITATGIREDKHSVIIVLTLPADKPTKVAGGADKAKTQRQVAEEHIQRQREIKLNGDVGNISRQLRLIPGL